MEWLAKPATGHRRIAQIDHATWRLGVAPLDASRTLMATATAPTGSAALPRASMCGSALAAAAHSGAAAPAAALALLRVPHVIQRDGTARHVAAAVLRRQLCHARSYVASRQRRRCARRWPLQLLPQLCRAQAFVASRRRWWRARRRPLLLRERLCCACPCVVIATAVSAPRSRPTCCLSSFAARGNAWCCDRGAGAHGSGPPAFGSGPPVESVAPPGAPLRGSASAVALCSAAATPAASTALPRAPTCMAARKRLRPARRRPLMLCRQLCRARPCVAAHLLLRRA